MIASTDTPITQEDLRSVFVYGRLPGLERRQLLNDLVKIGGRFARSGRTATAVVLAHASAASCLANGARASLPFEPRDGAKLLSEGQFRRRLDMSIGEGGTDAPYGRDDLARLSALSPDLCDALALFDVVRPVHGRFDYQDVSSAKQVASLLANSVPLPSIVNAAIELGRRGQRLSQVRLAETPWGDLVQRMGEKIARLDGQFALALDEEAQHAESAFEQAQAAEAADDGAEAERLYRRAEMMDRTDPVIPFNLGNLLASQSRVPEAVAAFQRSLKRDATFVEARFNLARLLETSGQRERAVEAYQATIAVAPDYAEALYNYARLLTQEGRHIEALPMWTRFIEAAPHDPDIAHARRLALLCRLELRSGS